MFEPDSEELVQTTTEHVLLKAPFSSHTPAPPVTQRIALLLLSVSLSVCFVVIFLVAAYFKKQVLDFYHLRLHFLNSRGSLCGGGWL